MKPGAPLVVAHLSVADGAGPGGQGWAGERDLWLSRYAAFQVASGVALEHAAMARDKIAAALAVLTPQQDEAVLREVGFSDVQMFYVRFAFRGGAGDLDDRPYSAKSCHPWAAAFRRTARPFFDRVFRMLHRD